MSASAQEIEWHIRGECARAGLRVIDQSEFLQRACRYMDRRERIVAARLGSPRDRKLLERYGK